MVNQAGWDLMAARGLGKRGSVSGLEESGGALRVQSGEDGGQGELMVLSQI